MPNIRTITEQALRDDLTIRLQRYRDPADGALKWQVMIDTGLVDEAGTAVPGSGALLANVFDQLGPSAQGRLIQLGETIAGWLAQRFGVDPAMPPRPPAGEGRP